MLFFKESCIINPCVFRSSVRNPIPKFIALCGDRILCRFPLIIICPESILSIPKIARANSVRPEPKRPAIPNISPRCTEKLISFNTSLRFRCSTRNISSPMVDFCLGNCAFNSRLTIMRINSGLETSQIF